MIAYRRILPILGLAGLTICAGCDQLGIHIGKPTRPTAKPVNQSAALKDYWQGSILTRRDERDQRPDDAAKAGPATDSRPSDRLATRPYSEWTLSETAADALSRIGQPAVPKLIEHLDDANPVIRERTANILAKIGPDAFESVPSLRRLLRDDHPPVRLAAARALGQIGPQAVEAVPDLMEILNDGN